MPPKPKPAVKPMARVPGRPKPGLMPQRSAAVPVAQRKLAMGTGELNRAGIAAMAGVKTRPVQPPARRSLKGVR